MSTRHGHYKDPNHNPNSLVAAAQDILLLRIQGLDLHGGPPFSD